MGIVYKLKKEVIDFVLRKKNENRALSCRQIAVIASEKFKIQVSKSSVNTIIKNARLSSSVGRRAVGDGRLKKFQIPPVKKKQLSDNMKKVGLEPVPSERSIPPVHVDTGKELKTQAVIPSAGEARAVDASYEKFLECVHRWRKTIGWQKGHLLDGMGFIFLKSVEWGMMGSSLFGKVLKRYFKNQPSACFEKSCEMLPYLNMVGVHGQEDAERFKNHALWTLTNSPDQSDLYTILDWTKENRLFPTLLMEYDNEIGQALLNVHRFDICLKNGKCVQMDAQLASLWKDKPPGSLFSSLSMAISLLSRSFISNNDPVIFFALGDESFSLGEMAEMMAACESTTQNTIKKIVAFDGKDNPVVEFSAIPFRKRFFLVGMWPWQKYFSEFAKYVYSDGYQPFYSKHLNAIFHFKELNADTFINSQLNEINENMRVIAVLDEHKNKPIVVILSNHTKMPAEDLAQAFILRWPNLDQGPAGNTFQRIGFMQYSDNIGAANMADLDTGSEYDRRLSVENNILSLSYDFGQTLQRRCRDQFFKEMESMEDLESICSHISGYYMRIDNVRHIILSPRSDHPHLREIKRAVLTINESAVTDFDGRLLSVQCDVKEIR